MENDPFREWLASDEGSNCASWPVETPEYLTNRLWWAFHAGKRAGEKSSQFANTERELPDNGT